MPTFFGAKKPDGFGTGNLAIVAKDEKPYPMGLDPTTPRSEDDFVQYAGAAADVRAAAEAAKPRPASAESQTPVAEYKYNGPTSEEALAQQAFGSLINT